MGRGKQTNKLYITHSEWSNEFGGMSFGGVAKKRQTEIFRRLPFFCCALSLQPFEHPVCTKEGIVFDLLNIVPYLKKHGKNPVTGESLEAKSLIKLNFHKNTKDEYHCPVTFRVFNDHTHIVAVRQTGNVYAYEAVERLNLKAKYWQDLLTDEPFTRKDLITIQDPHDISKSNLEKFWHLKTEGKGNVDEALEEEKKDPLRNINAKGTTKRALAEITESKAKKASTADSLKQNPSAPKPAIPYNAAHFSTGAAAASFTSTAATPVTSNTRALIDEEEFMFKQIKKKGYVRLVTNIGNLNLELFCDEVPRTCYNFIQLAKSGFYNNVTFHRSIKNFMLQGGDPTGTGKGGESYWKKDFPDEIKHGLSHSSRGLLSMANRGKGTNSSQFFITYRPCKHLDGKHSIFGKVAGGMPTLDKMEAIQTDDDDRPLSDITITDVQVFMDPYEEFQQRLDRKLKYQQDEADSRNKPKELTRDEKETWFGTKLVTDKVSNEQTTGGVGKYLAGAKKNNGVIPSSEKELEPVAQKKKTISKGGFGDFGGW